MANAYTQPETEIKKRFSRYTDQFTKPEREDAPNVEIEAQGPHDQAMTVPTRDEVISRLEASEARVAMAVEGMRADAATLRADLREGTAQIRSQFDKAQGEAAKFYADAGKVLAEMRLENEQHKSQMMAVGYKVITWTLGTLIAVAGVGLGAYTALKKSPPTQTIVLPALPSQLSPPTPSAPAADPSSAAPGQTGKPEPSVVPPPK